MSDRNDKNARAILANSGIDQAIAKGTLRPHERERAIDLACDNWTGRQGCGKAAEIAVESIKRDS